MEPEPSLIFSNISSLANLNSRNKSLLHIKLLGKGIQEIYTLIILWVSNLSFLQIKLYGERDQTLK